MRYKFRKLVALVQRFEEADEDTKRCPELLLSSPYDSDEPARIMEEFDLSKEHLFAYLREIEREIK